MTARDVTFVVGNLRDLPALPSVVIDLIAAFGRDDIDVTTLADKMSMDQGMAAKILRIANSSFYGLAGKVKTVRQAVLVLGFDNARALAVASQVIDHFGGAHRARVAEFWRHSIATAVCARSLARHAGLDHDAAFIAGLLHDIGRLVLAVGFPDEYARVLDACAADEATLGAAELRILGVDHERVGQMLAEAWKFPPVIRRAIGNHHGPAGADLADIPGVVHAANAVVLALDLDGATHAAVPPLLDAAWDSLGLTDSHLLAACRETEGQFEEACRLLMRSEDHER
jgi:putative nucleotidyltransferase with HDIG domain